MMQNARVTAFTVFELLRESEQVREGMGGKITPSPPPQIRVKMKKVIKQQ